MCDFCENIGIGIPCLNFSDQDEPNWIRSGEYIGIRQILNRKALVFTNSADEYGYGALDIIFCPICGRKLDEEKELPWVTVGNWKPVEAKEIGKSQEKIEVANFESDWRKNAVYLEDDCK